jgi:hypothetical protein
MNNMKMLRFVFVAALLLMVFVSPCMAADATLTLTLKRDAGNAAAPTMGDRLRFWSTLTNTGDKPVEGLVAWISLVEIDPGNEQPVDLEDWSVHKAITGAALGPGQSLQTDWPMRLIKGGDYRVTISATDRNSRTVFTSPTIEFHVRQKPVLQPGRILPVATCVPLLLIGLLAFNRARRRHAKHLS